MRMIWEKISLSRNLSSLRFRCKKVAYSSSLIRQNVIKRNIIITVKMHFLLESAFVVCLVNGQLLFVSVSHSTSDLVRCTTKAQGSLCVRFLGIYSAIFQLQTTPCHCLLDAFPIFYLSTIFCPFDTKRSIDKLRSLPKMLCKHLSESEHTQISSVI